MSFDPMDTMRVDSPEGQNGFMDPLDTHRLTSEEIVLLAPSRGLNLEPLQNGTMFCNDQRSIYFWRKDAFPGSGPVEEPEGTLHYSLQGAIGVPPSSLAKSASVFQGTWSEAGTLESLEKSLDLLIAWLLEKKEVDELPSRIVRRYGIVDPLDTGRLTTEEIVLLASSRGLNLGPLRLDTMFHKDQRVIFFWRKDTLPGSGPFGEAEGTLHYNMQGAIGVLPSRFEKSASAFKGMWSEAGTLESVEQALDLLIAWLVEATEVDELPSRIARRYGI